MVGKKTPDQPNNRRRQDRPSSLSTDDLNNASLGHSFASEDEQRRYFVAVPHADPAHATPTAAKTESVNNPSLGRFTYTFTKGRSSDRYFYTGDVKRDGSVDGKVYRTDDTHIEGATLLPHQTDMLKKFAREDVAQAQTGAKDQHTLPHVQLDISYHNARPASLAYRRHKEMAAADVRFLSQQSLKPGN